MLLNNYYLQDTHPPHSDLSKVVPHISELVNIYYEGFNLSLDKNTYSSIVDYELEVESSSMEHAQEQIKKILNDCSITSFSINKVSKQARALNALEK